MTAFKQASALAEDETSTSQPEAKRNQRSAKKRNRQPWPSLAKPTPVLDYSRENARFDNSLGCFVV